MSEGINTSLYADATLQCYYRFNSGALTTDSKGSLTLTSNGSPTDTAGKWGNAVSLDTSAYYSRSTALTAGEPWSMNVWIKDYTTGCIFSSKAGSYEWYISTSSTQLGIHAHWTDNSDTDITAGSFPAGTDTTKWNMITVTANQSGSDAIIKGYVNKTLVINQTVANKNVGVVESPFYLSYYYVEGKSGSAGKVDDFMFFKNKVLTTAEIEQLYADNGGSFILNNMI